MKFDALAMAVRGISTYTPDLEFCAQHAQTSGEALKVAEEIRQLVEALERAENLALSQADRLPN